MTEAQKQYERQLDREIAATILKAIPYFHRLYAKYKRPESLEAAKAAGIVLDKLYKKYETP